MEKVKKGDTYRWGAVSVQVTRVAKDGSWADICGTTEIFSRGLKRLPLPFPDSFVKSDHGWWMPAPRQLTEEEASAVASLQRLAKRWPNSIMLVSMDGSLSVVDKAAYHAGNEDHFNAAERQEACVLAHIDGITNDGGAW